MKLKRILDAIAIIGMLIIAVVMFSHNWILAGFFMSLIILKCVVDYFEILHMTDMSYTIETRKKRRAAYIAMNKK
jgi:hypothetical protein